MSLVSLMAGVLSSASGGGGGGSDPTSISSIRNRYKATDLVLSDNDPVTTWVDSIGSDDLTSSGTARPTYKANAGDPYLEFDGTNDVLSNLTVAGGWGDFTAVVIASILTTGVDFERILDMGSVSLHTMAAGTIQAAVLGAGPAEAMPARPTGFMAVYMERNGTSMRVRIDGSESTDTVGTSSTSPQILIGEFVSGGFNKNMQVKEVILYNNNMSVLNFGILESYVLSEYGLTL